MSEANFGNLRKQAKKHRSTIAHEKRSEEFRVGRGETPWPVFNENVQAYVYALSTVFPQLHSIQNRFKERKERHEKVLVVDVFGIADASSIGADHTVALTLTRTPEMRNTSTRTIVDGDIFNKKDMERFLKAIDSQNTEISCVFFRPIGGLSGYPKNLHTYAKLYDALSELYRRLALNGEIYIQALFFSEEIVALKHALNTHAGVAFCQMGQTKNGSGSSNLRIERTEFAPNSLPKLKELSINWHLREQEGSRAA